MWLRKPLQSETLPDKFHASNWSDPVASSGWGAFNGDARRDGDDRRRRGTSHDNSRRTGNQGCVGHTGQTKTMLASSLTTFSRHLKIIEKGGKA